VRLEMLCTHRAEPPEWRVSRLLASRWLGKGDGLTIMQRNIGLLRAVASAGWDAGDG
jgi:hypothetical protein